MVPLSAWRASLRDDFAVDITTLDSLDQLPRRELQIAVQKFLKDRCDTHQQAVLRLLQERGIVSNLVTALRFAHQNLTFTRNKESQVLEDALTAEVRDREYAFIRAKELLAGKFSIPVPLVDKKAQTVNLGAGIVLRYELKDGNMNWLLIDTRTQMQWPIFAGDAAERFGEVMQELLENRTKALEQMVSRDRIIVQDAEAAPYLDSPVYREDANIDDDSEGTEKRG